MAAAPLVTETQKITPLRHHSTGSFSIPHVDDEAFNSDDTDDLFAGSTRANERAAAQAAGGALLPAGAKAAAPKRAAAPERAAKDASDESGSSFDFDDPNF